MRFTAQSCKSMRFLKSRFFCAFCISIVFPTLLLTRDTGGSSNKNPAETGSLYSNTLENPLNLTVISKRSNRNDFPQDLSLLHRPMLTPAPIPSGTTPNSMSVSLENFKNSLLNEQRQSIVYEMEEYDFNGPAVATNTVDNYNTTDLLDKLVMDKGGTPIRNIIFATWRSGSTFLGDLLNSHPANFYHYEPLLHMKVRQVRSNKDAKEATKVLGQLLLCNYTNLDKYNHWDHYQTQERNQHNKRLWRFCQRQKSLCNDPSFLGKMCRLFPFQSVKTVRMRLRLGKFLFRKASQNTRLLLLVRDPRGIMRSRRQRDWCQHGPDCAEPELLCKDMLEDYKYAELFRHQFPGRFLYD